MRIYLVPQNIAMDSWPHVKEFLEHATEPARGRMSASDIMGLVSDGLMQLWLVSDGTELCAVVVTEIIKYPQLTVCRVAFMAGKDRKKWLHLLDDIEGWARDEQRCTRMEAFVRPGLARVLEDYSKTHLVLEKVL